MTTSELKSKLTKSVDYLRSELAQIRTGRATPALIEDVEVMAYDSKMTVKELGNITSLESQTLAVIPWDKSLINTIAAAIRDAKLGLNPVEDSDRVRIPIPPLTEERRNEFAKMVSTKAEEVKASLRNIRQEAVKDVERDFADKKMGEDEKFRQKENIEDVIKEFVQQVDDIAATKKSDIMKI